MLKTGRKGAVCCVVTWGLTSMSVEGITGVSSGSPQRGYDGKRVAEVILEHQGNPRTSSTELGPGKIFSLFWKGLWGSGVCV